MRSARVDYITGRFMIVHKNGGPNAEPDSAYAAGNEEETNPSILSLVVKDGMLRRRQDTDDKIVKGWSIRVFEDKNPIVTMAEDNEYGKEPLANQPIYGHHLVVVASPDTGKELSTIDVEQWSNVLVVVQDRLRWLNMQKGVAYVAIYADHDKALHGTVKMHPHLNIVSFKTVPPTIKDEMRSYQKSQEKMGICPTCYFIGSDGKDRIILKTESFVSYCPWSPSYPLEFSITPRRHSTSFAKITQKEIEDLALMMRAMLGGLVEITQDVPYSIVFHLAGEKRASRVLHWHVSVYPATKRWSGMERGFGIHLNDLSPEDAARMLRAACKKELVGLIGIE